MGFFVMSTEKQLSAERTKHIKLNTLLLKAEADVAAATATAKALAADAADDDQMHNAEADVRSCVDLLARRKAALDESVLKIAALERERDAEADKALRTKTGAEVEQTTRRIVDASEALVKAAATYADYLARIAPFVPEAQALMHLCQVCIAEVPATNDTVARLAREYGASVLRGHAAAAMPVPPATYTAPATAPKPPTAQLFCLRSIKFVDDTGQQRFVGQYRDASVPQRLVARALRSGACVAVDDPRRVKLHTQGDTTQHPDGAFDLDNAEEERQAEPIMASTPPQFVPFDRGPPVVMKVVR